MVQAAVEQNKRAKEGEEVSIHQKNISMNGSEINGKKEYVFGRNGSFKFLLIFLPSAYKTV